MSKFMVDEILDDDDYNQALARVAKLMDAEPGSPEGEELDALVDEIVFYEVNEL